MAIKRLDLFSTALKVGDSGTSIRGYFSSTNVGGLAGRELVEYDQNKVYTIQDLYINDADQVVLHFKEGVIADIPTIKLLFVFPKEDCKDDITVNITPSGSDYTGTNTTLYDLLADYVNSSIKVYVTLNYS